MYYVSLEKVAAYNSIFELAKVVLHLPQYFNDFEDKLIERTVDTDAKALLSNPLTRTKFGSVESKYKIRDRLIWYLNTSVPFIPDRFVMKDQQFKVETDGYWKSIGPDEQGTDRKGNVIVGRTWVTTTESYYHAPVGDLVIQRSGVVNDYIGVNAGFVYVMRNAAMGKDIFKIGLTRNNTSERAKQLSNTSVPDGFYVICEWAVRDCVSAEAEIHKQLHLHRVDPKREFFKLNLQMARGVIDDVVKFINSAS